MEWRKILIIIIVAPLVFNIAYLIIIGIGALLYNIFVQIKEWIISRYKSGSKKQLRKEIEESQKKIKELEKKIEELEYEKEGSNDILDAYIGYTDIFPREIIEKLEKRNKRKKRK